MSRDSAARRAQELWADWCAATGHDPREITRETLARFGAQVPVVNPGLVKVRPAAASRTGRTPRDPWTAAERSWAPLGMSLAQCPTHGWPQGVAGRRDAFLIVVTRVLRMPRSHAVSLRGRSLPALRERLPGAPVDGACLRCVTTRWLEVVLTQDIWTMPSVKEQVWAPPRSSNGLASVGSARPCDGSCEAWGRLAEAIDNHVVLAPAIDRHGWWRYWRPMTARSLTAVLAARCDPSAPPPVIEPFRAPTEQGADEPAQFDASTLQRLDAAIAAAEDANERVEAWLAEYESSRSKFERRY